MRKVQDSKTESVVLGAEDRCLEQDIHQESHIHSLDQGSSPHKRSLVQGNVPHYHSR